MGCSPMDRRCRMSAPITTRAELESVPIGSYLADGDGYVLEKATWERPNGKVGVEYVTIVARSADGPGMTFDAGEIAGDYSGEPSAWFPLRIVTLADVLAMGGHHIDGGPR